MLTEIKPLLQSEKRCSSHSTMYLDCWTWVNLPGSWRVWFILPDLASSCLFKVWADGDEGTVIMKEQETVHWCIQLCSTSGWNLKLYFRLWTWVQNPKTTDKCSSSNKRLEIFCKRRHSDYCLDPQNRNNTSNKHMEPERDNKWPVFWVLVKD